MKKNNFSTNIFDYVKENINIVDVIKRDEQLKREASGWRGGHFASHESESGNCLYVNETEQWFYCHHCHVGGSVIDYVMDRDGLEPFFAAKSLCTEYGLPIPDWTEEQKEKWEKRKQEEARVGKLLTECFNFYHEQLTSERRQYLYDRGLTDETIDSELIGYAEDGNALTEHMVSTYGSEILKQLSLTGLIFADSKIRDRYQGYYVFPYFYRGKIKFSIGRNAGKNNPKKAKYVKHLTPQSYPYVSDVAVEHVLWGEDNVRGKKEVIIAEGVFGALLTKQLGYPVCSPFTNQVSRKDIEKLLERTSHADTVYIIFDNEKSGAGKEGAKKAARALTKEGRRVKIVTIPRPEHIEKIDLADFIVQNGDNAKDAVDKLLSSAVGLFTFSLYQIDPLLDKSEIYDKLDPIIKEAVEVNTEEAKIRDWLEHTVRDYFNLAVREISNYRAIIKKHVKERKEKEIKIKKEEKQKKASEKHDTIENLDYSLPLWQVIEEAHWRYNSEGEQYRVNFIKPEWKLSEIVENWFDANDTKWFSDSFNTPFIFHKKLYEIGDNPRFCAFFQDIARMNNTTPEGRYLFKALQNIAVKKGKKTLSSSWLHLDRSTHSIYVNLSKESEKLLKISPHKIETVPNATNDKNILLYSSDKMKPIEFLPDVEIEEGIKLFRKKVLDNLACNPQNRLLVGCWTLAVFVKGYTQSRALMKFSGGHQAGKTVGAKLLASLIYGTPTVKVSTVAANFTDAAKNPLSFIDDLETENLSDSYLQFLRLAATGATKEKRDVRTTTQNVREKVDALVLITAIDPLAQQTLISRSYDINFNRRYQNTDFLEDDVIYEIINHRNLILSSIFKVLAENVLPRFAEGDQREIVKMLRLEYPNHAKQRTNAFLASLYMIYEGLNHYSPLEDASPKEVLDKWISVQEEEASSTAAETTPILLYLNSLWDYFAKSNELFLEIEGDKVSDDIPSVLRQYGHLITPELNEKEEFVAFSASANSLHNAFAKYCRQHGLKYKFSNPRQVMKHISDAEELLIANGWEIEMNVNRSSKERFHKFVRHDDVVPF